MIHVSTFGLFLYFVKVTEQFYFKMKTLIIVYIYVNPLIFEK